VDAATASPPGIELGWVRAPGGGDCIPRQELSSRVEATIGHRVFANEGEASVHGTIGPSAAGGWLAVVELRHEGRPPVRRELSLATGDCRAFDEALVLVVALMVDTTASGPARMAIAPPREPASVSVGLGMTVASGMLPGVVVGFGLSSEIALPPLWPIDLWAYEWPGAQATAGASGGELSAWMTGIGLCPRLLSKSRWEVFACAGGAGGSVYSSGVSLDVALHRTRAYAELEARGGVRLRLAGPLGLGVQLGAGVPLSRDAYDYTRANGAVQEVFRTAPIVPMADIGLEIREP
jgi:hypothetical protein